MAVGKGIRTQINSVSSTRKITSAMEMVAASKMRRAQDAMARGKPYAIHIRNLMSHIAAANLEYEHPYFRDNPETNRVGYIVVSTDRGLCGGLNVNLFKETVASMRMWQDKKAKVSLCAIGAKGMAFFGGLGADVVASVRDVGERPQIADLIGVVGSVLERFEQGELDKVYLAGNEFVSTMNQAPTLTQLLPLAPMEQAEEAAKQHWDYIYEPDDARSLLSGLLVRYIESLVYQSVVENAACEQAARMIAMKNATENAGELIKELQLAYNKERQSVITQELSEIVGGAAAVQSG